MEKPRGHDIRDFEYLANIVKTRGKVFHTGYMYRYNPLIEYVIAKVKNGELAHIYSIEYI